MLKSIRALDRLLKGEVTRLPALRAGTIDVPLGGLSGVILVLGIIYGVCMGVFAVVARWSTPDVYMGYEQLAASAVKVPALFFLTLLVTFPSLYVFNALVGSRLAFGAVLRLLVASLGVILAVLASFGTIVVFFSLCTTSYSFMVLLNVVMFAIAGTLGLGFLLQTLQRLSIARQLPAETIAAGEPAPSSPAAPSTVLDAPVPPVPTATIAAPGPIVIPAPVPPAGRGVALRMNDPGALDRAHGSATHPSVQRVFQIWLLVFALVGAQMGWVLRPFIGNPAVPFSLFRPRGSNFFESVLNHLRHLFS